MIKLYLLTIALQQFALIIILVKYYRKSKRKEQILLEEKKDWLSNKSKLSMIEVKLREYKEGANIFTVMRDIQDIIRINYERQF